MTLATADIFGPSFLPGRVGDNRPIVYWDDFITAFTVLDSGEALGFNTGGTFCDLADSADYRLSFSGNPSIFPSMADEVGGVVTMTTGALNANRFTAQLNGEMFRLDSSREIYFEARVNVSSTGDFFIGVSTADTNLAGLDNAILMGVNGTSTLVYRQEANDTGVTDNVTSLTGITITSGGWHVMAFKARVDKKVEYYLDGVRVATSDDSVNFPSDMELTPSFQINANSAVAQTLKIDYILCVGDR